MGGVALSMDARRELASAFAKAAATSVVVLRGAGRSFCVGYDLVGSSGNEAWRRDALEFHQRLGASLALELTPWYMKKPVVASMQGHALGAGCELAMFCGPTIAADGIRRAGDALLASRTRLRHAADRRGSSLAR